MPKDGQQRVRLSPTLPQAVAGTISVLLWMLCLLLLKDLTGISRILCGIGLWLSGAAWGLWLGVSGERSLTGPTSNSQGVSQFHQTTKPEPSLQLADLMPYGKLPSTNQDLQRPSERREH